MGQVFVTSTKAVPVMSSNFSSKNGNSEARRGVITARILTQIGTEQGVDMSTLLASTGLTDIALQDDGTAISLQQEIQLIRNLQQALPAIQTLGLIAGNQRDSKSARASRSKGLVR